MRKKTALCVGINDYPGSNNDLRGCVNDANDWAQLLASQGYQVQILLDSAATRGTILQRLTDLVGTAGFGDRIVFTYSGHGSWVPDSSGDEPDGRDEVLCAYDFPTGGLVSDDDLHAIFSDLHYGTSALVLSDSCHSGTVNRFAAVGEATDSRPARTPRFISPLEFRFDLSQERVVELENREASTSRRTASLISGCDDPEYSYDAWFGNRPNGAFTRAAIDSYKSGMSLAGWYKAIRGLLPSESYPQTPQLNATQYRKYRAAL